MSGEQDSFQFIFSLIFSKIKGRKNLGDHQVHASQTSVSIQVNWGPCENADLESGGVEGDLSLFITNKLSADSDVTHLSSRL